MKINKERIMKENVHQLRASLVSDLLLTSDLTIEDCSEKKLPQRVAESDPEFIIKNIALILDLFKDFNFFKVKRSFNIGLQFTDNELTELKNELLNLKESSSCEDYQNMISGFIDYINNDCTVDMEITREMLSMSMISRRVSSYAVLESAFDSKMYIIASNINYNPSAIRDYGKLLSEIERSTKSDILNNAIGILDHNTKLVLAIDIEVGRDMHKMICEMPMVLARRISQEGIPVGKNFVKAIDIQFQTIELGLKEGEPRFYDLYSDYLSALGMAKNYLITKSDNIIFESISGDDDLYDNEQLYSEVVLDDLTGDMDDLALDMLFDDMVEDNEEELIESYMNRMIVAEQTYKVLLEKAKKQNKIGKINKMAHKASKTISRGKKTVGQAARPAEMLAKSATKMIDDIMKFDKEKRRDAILTGGWKGKLKSMLRKLILMIASFAIMKTLFPVGPVVALLATPVMKIISIFLGVAIDKKVRIEDRRMIVKELELELKIVEEKINDSRSDTNPKAKYQLMRIQNQLETDLEQARYGL